MFECVCGRMFVFCSVCVCLIVCLCVVVVRLFDCWFVGVCVGVLV